MYTGFMKEEFWSGLPFSPLGDHSDQGIKPRFPALQVDSLALELLTAEAHKVTETYFK